MKFTDEDKKPIVTSFPFGVHKVEIIGIATGVTPNGSEYIEFGFINEDGIEGKARKYFTEKSKNFGFDACRAILIHNTPKEQRDKANKVIDAVQDHEELATLMTKKLIGKEAWVTKYYDASGATYVGNDGNTYRSTKVEIMAYETKLKEELMPPKKESATEAANSVFGQDLPFESSSSNTSGESTTGWM